MLEEASGEDLGDWLARAVDSTEELDYQEALDWYGLRFTSSEPEEQEKDSAEPKELPAGWLGMEAENENGRLMVTQVKRGTPAYEAGVNVGDEILAIDEYRVPPEGLEEPPQGLPARREGDPAGGPPRDS